MSTTLRWARQRAVADPDSLVYRRVLLKLVAIGMRLSSFGFAMAHQRQRIMFDRIFQRFYYLYHQRQFFGKLATDEVSVQEPLMIRSTIPKLI